MSGSYVQVPPQSTGRKIATTARTQIKFDNEANGGFTVGDTITGVTSGVSAVVTAIVTAGFTLGTDGELYLKNISPALGQFSNDEALQVSASTKGNANIPGSDPQVDIELQSVVIADFDNPENRQHVGSDGAQRTTFTEGSPIFSPFGDMIAAAVHSIHDYTHSYDEHDAAWYENAVGTGAVTYNADAKTITLDTGGTADLAGVTRTTHLYHPYEPGTGTLVEMTIAQGDVGKTNSRRRWGYYDDNNGIFFQLDGTTLSVCTRSNTSGSPVDSPVAQGSWNGNQLDGTSSTPFTIDLTKINIFWFDFQWLGAGVVRMGVYTSDGERRIAHTFKNANSMANPYMRTGTLPVRVENLNTGVTSGNSQMKFTCASVKAVGEPEWARHHHSAGVTARLSVADTDGEVPIISICPKTTFKNSLRNSVISTLEDVTVGGITASVQYILRIRKDPTVLTTSSFASHGVDSGVEVDTAATAVSGGHLLWQRIVDGDEAKSFNISDDVAGKSGNALGTDFQIVLEADDVTQQTLSLTIEVVDTGSVGILAVIEWNEIQL